jgi:hypothetical protein
MISNGDLMIFHDAVDVMEISRFYSKIMHNYIACKMLVITAFYPMLFQTLNGLLSWNNIWNDLLV